MSPISKLQPRLEARTNPKTRIWWESYLRQVIPFRGVKMADIRTALHAWIAAEGIEVRLSLAQQKELALSLVCERYAEDKLAGILFLQEVLLPKGAITWQSSLPEFARLFAEGCIYDWSTCDWFCVKVLGPLVEQQGEACARGISEWRDAENLWQRRAAGVAFVNLAKHGDKNFDGFSDMLFEICATTVKHQERFAQTGVGWVLRELSVADQERVACLVQDHLDEFSTESLRNAVKKLPNPVRERLIRAHRDRQDGRVAHRARESPLGEVPNRPA